MSSFHRIGLIGLDTSHVEAFVNILNNPKSEHHIPGGKIVAGYPGGSADIELSISRVDGYTQKLKGFGAKILDSPEAVATCCDMLFITTIDGRVHKDIFQKVVLRDPVHMQNVLDMLSNRLAGTLELLAYPGKK